MKRKSFQIDNKYCSVVEQEDGGYLMRISVSLGHQRKKFSIKFHNFEQLDFFCYHLYLLSVDMFCDLINNKLGKTKEEK